MSSPNSTPFNAWFAPVLSGMNLVYGSNTTLTVKAGQCSNSGKTNIFSIGDVLINAATNGAAGLDTGALANSTYYYVYAIGSTGFSTLRSAIISASATQPLLPVDYDMYRKVGVVLTDGSAHILSFRQTGEGVDRTMWYDAAISVLSGGTSATYANVNLVTGVPGAKALEVLLLATVTPTSAADSLNLVPYDSTATVGYAVLTGSVASVAAKEIVRLPSALNSGVPYVKYKVSGTASLSIAGYIDQL